jgi:hypothetical protein
LAPKLCYYPLAFVALVKPLDTFEGAASITCSLFSFTAGGGNKHQIAQIKEGNT